MSLTTNRNGRAILWALRGVVALQCLGNAWWFLSIQETPLLSVMCGAADVGGLAWSEDAALAVQRIIGWCLPVAAACVLVRPSGWVLGPLAVLQLAIAVAMARMHMGFQPQASWLAPGVASLFPLLSQSGRIAALLVLLLVDPPKNVAPVAGKQITAAAALARWAIAVTFLAHGVEALQHYYQFVDLILLTARRWTPWDPSQAAAEDALTLIGLVDLALALLAVTVRWTPVMWYMAFWGLVTALSRGTAYGFDLRWHEVATRAPHFGLPLALALYWWCARQGVFEQAKAGQAHHDAKGEHVSDGKN